MRTIQWQRLAFTAGAFLVFESANAFGETLTNQAPEILREPIHSAHITYAKNMDRTIGTNVTSIQHQYTFVFDQEDYFIRGTMPHRAISESGATERQGTTWQWKRGDGFVEGSDGGAMWQIRHPNLETSGMVESVKADLRNMLISEMPSWTTGVQPVNCSETNGVMSFSVLDEATSRRFLYTAMTNHSGETRPTSLTVTDAGSGKIRVATTWSDWTESEGMMFPSLTTMESEVVTKSGGLSSTTVWVRTTYVLLGVEKLNQPVHAQWFYPRFPASPVQITDRTKDPALMEELRPLER